MDEQPMLPITAQTSATANMRVIEFSPLRDAHGAPKKKGRRADAFGTTGIGGTIDRIQQIKWPRFPGPAKSTPLAMPDIPPETSRPQSRFRFSIGWLLLISFVVAVAAAGGGGLYRAQSSRAFFVMFLLASPVAVLILVATFQKLTRKRRPPG